MLNLNFCEWLCLSENIFLEGFKEKREQFISQGNEESIIDKYINDFKTIKDKNYKQLKDEIHGITVPINQRNNIDAYPNFHQLEILVDYVKGQVDVKSATFEEIKIDATPIYENNEVQIYYADTPRACITYKGNVPYSWCIARNDSSNLFYAYRYKEHEPSFYFVKSKERIKKEFGFWNLAKVAFTGQFKDKYHFIVIQTLKNAKSNDHNKKQYIVTSAMNDGDKQMSWNEILEVMPELSGLEDKFVHMPISGEDREFYEKYKNGISDDDFAKLEYAQKSKFMDVFVRLDRGLSTKQFIVLPFDLKNKYIGFGVGLTDDQYKLIESDRKLVRRYEDVTLDKIKLLIKDHKSLKLKNSESKILFKNLDKIEFTDEVIRFLLIFAENKDEIAKLIINNKTELSGDNVYNLLYHAINKDEIEKILGTGNINKLSDDNVYNLLRFSKDKDEIAKLIINNKTELSGDNVYNLLIYAIDKDEIAKMLGTGNINKLTGNNVYNLFKYPKDKNEIAKILGTKNINKLTGNNVYSLLLSATNENEIAKMLGTENINKLSDDNIYNLLTYAMDEDEDEITKLIINNITELSNDNVYNLLYYAKDKDEIAKLIINRKQELTNDNVYNLLRHSKDKDEIAKLIINRKQELTDNNVEYLLYYATDKDEIKILLKEKGITVD